MNEFIFGEQDLTIEDVRDIAGGQKKTRLSDNRAFRDKIDAGADFLDDKLKQLDGIYGVTTGYGDSCGKAVPPEKYYELPLRLTRFHGCGMGKYFDRETTRAIIAVRLNTLCRGYSGVSWTLLETTHRLLELDILPLIPEEGSVGASGDLTPLSYIAGTLVGERNVIYKDEVYNSADLFKKLSIPLITLRPKEGLAMMNGTGVMNAVAALAYSRAEYLSDLSCRITALASIALRGNAYHFSKRLFDIKPHPGMGLCAEKIRNDLGGAEDTDVVPERIQDIYSIRCAPHVIGMFYDTAPLLRTLIETEMNSANDNPIIDPETNSIYHGGHFYGGHIAFAMDSLKNVVANIADLLDRQLAVLVDEKFNRGLPPNLSGSCEGYSFNHGFKAVQIAVSSWTAEALKGTMPASVFSRSTECHNQDKVSMGTIAARDCIRVIELTEQVTTACLLAAVQAVRLREKAGSLKATVPAALAEFVSTLDRSFPLLEADRPLESELRDHLSRLRSRTWEV